MGFFCVGDNTYREVVGVNVDIGVDFLEQGLPRDNAFLQNH